MKILSRLIASGLLSFSIGCGIAPPEIPKVKATRVDRVANSSKGGSAVFEYAPTDSGYIVKIQNLREEHEKDAFFVNGFFEYNRIKKLSKFEISVRPFGEKTHYTVKGFDGLDGRLDGKIDCLESFAGTIHYRNGRLTGPFFLNDYQLKWYETFGNRKFGKFLDKTLQTYGEEARIPGVLYFSDIKKFFDSVHLPFIRPLFSFKSNDEFANPEEREEYLKRQKAYSDRMRDEFRKLYGGHK